MRSHPPLSDDIASDTRGESHERTQSTAWTLFLLLASAVASALAYFCAYPAVCAFFGGIALTLIARAFLTKTLLGKRVQKRVRNPNTAPPPRLEHSLKDVPVGIATLTGERIDFVNDAFFKLLGRVPGSVKQLPELLRHPKALQHVRDGSGAMLFTLGTNTFRLHAHTDGDDRVLALFNISRTVHLETVRTDFVANVSHALRTPLAVVRSNLEALDDEVLQDPELSAKFIARIERQSKRLEALVEDILELSRIESESVELSPERIYLKKELRTHLDYDDVEYHIPQDIFVYTDRRALFQILSNLIENALRHAPDSKVSVHAELTDTHVGFEVADTGPGVDLEWHDRIFERFFRPPDHTHEGTGLGLSIVKNLTLKLGGECGVKANKPQGAVFWVRFPKVKEENLPDEARSEIVSS